MKTQRQQREDRGQKEIPFPNPRQTTDTRRNHMDREIEREMKNHKASEKV